MRKGITNVIQPTYGTLQTLFSDRVFRIPRYQRFYSWRCKQRQDLFDDLVKLYARGGDNHHFMATIVCHKTKEVTPVGAKEYRLYDVVDGQQRLTTLIILLKAIQLNLQSGTEERSDLEKLLIKADGHLILLQTNNANEHIFNSFIREGREPSKDEVQTHADKNLRDAIRDCRKFVSEWQEEYGDIMPLVRLLMNRLGFVFYDTEDSRVVYTIFEVLNSRGLAVDWLDKCKSVLMEKAFERANSDDAADAAINALQSIWGNVYREIAQISIGGDEILRVTATLTHGPCRGKPQSADESLQLLRDECTAADSPRQVSERILDVTRKLSALEKNKFLGPVTGILHARILAVSLMSTDILDGAEKEDVLRQWERVTFRIFGLYGKDSRTKVGEYIRLATKVMNKSEGAKRYSQIMESLRSLGADFPIDRAVNEGLRGKNIYERSAHLTRYILWKYEENLARSAGNRATVDPHARAEIWNMHADDSIEHIYPQSPEEGGPWEGKMGRAPGEHIHRIGNLILLPIDLNAEARRQGFAQKKEVYRRHRLRMIEEIESEGDWTLAELENRESRIVNWATHEWSDL